MTHPRWVLASITLILAALAAPSVSLAAPKLYSGTVTIHEFGNDLTTGSFTTGLGKTASCPTKGVGLNKYGQVCGKGTTFATKSYYAMPIGRYCNTVYTGIGPLGMTLGMGNPTSPCYTTPTFHEGAPLTGAGVANTLGGPGPPGFSVMVGEIRRTVKGSFPGCYGCYLHLTSAMLYNAAGSLFPGGGPGKLTFTPALKGAFGQVRISPGPRRFGGTMRLLGLRRSYDYYQTYKAGFLQIGYVNWLWPVFGGPVSNMQVYTNTVYNTQGFNTITSVAATGFPWTTGKVTVTALSFGIPSILVRTGYDNRNATGSGAIQLVAPKLTHWTPAQFPEDTAAIAILRLEFVPEPASGVVIACGVLVLGLLQRRRRG